MVKPYTQIKPSVFEAIVASSSNCGSQSNELYPSRVIAHTVNSAGIELPIPLQIVHDDHTIESPMETHALNMIISKTHSTSTKPPVLIRPKAIA